MRKPPFQQFFGGTEAGIDGTDGDIEDIRDLFERKILKIEQSYDDAVLLRQGQKGAAQIDAAVDILLVGGDGREEPLFFIIIAKVELCRVILAFARVLKAVHTDSEQPLSEICALSEALVLFDSLSPCVLIQILGVAAVGAELEAKAPQVARVQLDVSVKIGQFPTFFFDPSVI